MFHVCLGLLNPYFIPFYFFSLFCFNELYDMLFLSRSIFTFTSLRIFETLAYAQLRMLLIDISVVKLYFGGSCFFIYIFLMEFLSFGVWLHMVNILSLLFEPKIDTSGV